MLGPSKLKGLIGCALSSSLSYKSPLGTLNVCFKAIRELIRNEEGFNFLLSDLDMEEEEHCIEVHIPFLIHCLGPTVEIIPIYIGEMNANQMDELADVLIPHFEREDALFIVLTNLTRWGDR